MKEPQIPSGEVMLDLKAAVEKLISPGNELEAVLVLAMARKPNGEVECRVYTVPVDEHDRLIKTMREYLAGPSGFKEYRT